MHEIPSEGNDPHREIPMAENSLSHGESFAGGEPLDTSLTPTDASAVDAVPESGLESDSNELSVSPAEAARAVAYAECVDAIAVRLDEAIAGGTPNTQPAIHIDPGRVTVTTPEIQITRDIIAQAARDGDAAAVRTFTRRLINMPYASGQDMMHAQLANAAVGDERAVAAVHNLLEIEHINDLLENEYERLGGPQPSTEPRGGSLHTRFIRQLADYGMPADEWIEPYTLDPVDAWGKTEDYLFTRLTPDPEADAPVADGVQEAYDAHAAQLVDMPDDLVVRQLPDVLPCTSDPAVRTALIDRYVALANDIPSSPETFKAKVNVAAELIRDARIEQTGPRSQFINTCAAERKALWQRHPDAELVHGYFPLVEALSRRQGDTAETVVAKCEAWTKVALGAPYADEGRAMHLHDQRLHDAALHFAGTGDFAAAHQALAAIQPGREARAAARERILGMTSEPAHLEPFQTDSAYQERGTYYDIDFEVATLRVTGNTDELRSRARAHVEAAGTKEYNAPPFTVTSTTPPSEAIEGVVDSAEHLSYAGAAFDAVKAVNPAAAVDMAREILPALRAQRRGHSSVARNMSQTLIAAGDTDELHIALAETLAPPAPVFADSTQRPQQVADLWDLARRIKRAG